MPETKQGRRSEGAELVAAVVIAAAVMTGVYLVADQLPLPITIVVAVVAAFGLTALVTYLMGGRR